MMPFDFDERFSPPKGADKVQVDFVFNDKTAIE